MINDARVCRGAGRDACLPLRLTGIWSVDQSRCVAEHSARNGNFASAAAPALKHTTVLGRTGPDTRIRFYREGRSGALNPAPDTTAAIPLPRAAANILWSSVTSSSPCCLATTTYAES